MHFSYLAFFSFKFCHICFRFFKKSNITQKVENPCVSFPNSSPFLSRENHVINILVVINLVHVLILLHRYLFINGMLSCFACFQMFYTWYHIVCNHDLDFLHSLGFWDPSIKIHGALVVHLLSLERKISLKGNSTFYLSIHLWMDI